MGDIEIVEMQFSKQTLVSIAVGAAKDFGRPISIVVATNNETSMSIHGKTGISRASLLSDTGEARYVLRSRELKVDVFSPESRDTLLILVVRRHEKFGLFEAQRLA